MSAGWNWLKKGRVTWLVERLSYRKLRRLAVLVVGGSVVCVGVAMVVLPGPAVVVIPLGLAILGAEFEWARRLLRQARERLDALRMSRNGTGKKDG